MRQNPLPSADTQQTVQQTAQRADFWQKARELADWMEQKDSEEN